MKALVFERNAPPLRGRHGGRARSCPGAGAAVGPLHAAPTSTRPTSRPPAGCGCGPAWPASAAPTWPRSTASRRRYFEPIVSFPFVPGHEVVGDLDDGTPGRARARARLRDPRHRPAVRAVRRRARSTAASASPSATSSPACRPATAATPAAAGRPRWSPTRASSRRARRPDRRGRGDGRADRLRGPRRPLGRRPAATSAVLGAGTLGLLTIAALRRLADAAARSSPPPSTPSSARWPRSSGADVVVDPGRAAPGRAAGHRLAASSATSSPAAPTRSSTASAAEASLAQALAGRRARRHGASCVGMPGHASASTSRRCGTARSRCVGCYAYTRRDDFDLAFELVRDGRPRPAGVAPPTRSPATARPSTTPPTPGRRGAVKIAFDLRDEKDR